MRLSSAAVNILLRSARDAHDSFGKHWYVKGWGGNDAKDGRSWDNAFLTMAKALTVIASGDTIHLIGRITEQVTAPLGVFDVTIIGESGVLRQSTANGVQAGYSAYWKYSDSDTATPNLELIEQGWSIINILFEPTATGTGIQLTRAEDAVHPDPSHALIQGCRFAGGLNGIVDSGGSFNLRIIDNIFQTQTGHAIKNIAGAGIALPQQWQILNNKFLNCSNGVYTGAKHFLVQGNFFTDGETPNTTTVLDLVGTGVSGEGSNFVIGNYFQTATANFNSPDIKGNATDVWNNVSIDGTFTSGGVNGGEYGTPA